MAARSTNRGVAGAPPAHHALLMASTAMNARSAAAASSIERGMRAPLHASATDRPPPKFDIVRGNGHEAASRYRSPRHCPGSPSSMPRSATL